ncbi:DNA directed RNA polymerase II 15 kDa subunit [Penicillium capsulatum]|uniref:DNA directed RNA polymerase II 15 kDa subunit n=1 Tax=Penicillium capsulatum TaxID=69766 RepID=A0A9W9IA71_9EURO|nr:DNA directed RNA polymerase II 15 kDa subunit [Penicillium capsulatum]KAJ6136461.1 DNA directed RNA polymerase II 15 kDa subunit [Penicillium capsulatum]
MIPWWLTLPRANKLCPSCGENEAVFFQSQQRSAETGMVSVIERTDYMEAGMLILSTRNSTTCAAHVVTSSCDALLRRTDAIPRYPPSFLSFDFPVSAILVLRRLGE